MGLVKEEESAASQVGLYEGLLRKKFTLDLWVHADFGGT